MAGTWRHLFICATVGWLSKIIALCDLCTADMEHRAISRGFSGRDLGKLFNISVTRGEQSSDNSATLGSELIAMSAGEFAQEPMSSLRVVAGSPIRRHANIRRHRVLCGCGCAAAASFVPFCVDSL